MTEYICPASVEEAISVLEKKQGAARIIAGGTDLMLDLRERRCSPHTLVDVTHIPDLCHIQLDENLVQIGAAVTFAQIEGCTFIKERVTALAEAANSIGASAIRSSATWAGNIVQAMPAADGAVVAIALKAEVRVVDHQGAVWRPAESLFEGPGVSAINPTRQLATHIRFPVAPSPRGTGWRRIARRASLSLPILNCAATIVLDVKGQEIQKAVIGLGPVAPFPYRARDAERYLKGQVPTPEVLFQAGQIAQHESNPRSSFARAAREYRLKIIPLLVRDTLETAVDRARCDLRNAS